MANERARQLRREMTDSENLLWSDLRNRQVDGCRFRRQHPMGPYILDFVCLARRFVVEIDGGHHDQPEQIEHDERRTRWLEERGYEVFRVDNVEVFENREGVVDSIRVALQQRPTFVRMSRADRLGRPRA